MKELPNNFPLPADSKILGVLQERSRCVGYPLTPEDVRDHLDLLMTLVKEKIRTLAGMSDDTPMTIYEALNTALMSTRWLRRNA
jgi:hypothetical protein